MNKKIFYSILIVLFYNCESDSINDISNQAPNPDPEVKVSYVTDIAPIMSANCTSCHSNPPISGAGIPLTTYSEVKDGIDQVLDRINRNEGDPKLMPIGGPKLPQSVIDKIQKWKDDGFEN